MQTANKTPERTEPSQPKTEADYRERGSFYERLTTAAHKFLHELQGSFKTIEESTKAALEELTNENDRRMIKRIAVKSRQELESTAYEATAAYLDTFPPEQIINPEIIHEPATYIIQRTQEIAERTGGCFLFFGEMHHELGILAYQSELVRHVGKSDLGLQTVILEEDERMQPYVDEFMRTGVLPTTLEKYLRYGFVRQDTAVKHDHKINLLKAAREVGARVVFIDQNDNPNRDKDWQEKITRIMGGRINGVHIMFCGHNHASRRMHAEATNYQSIGELLSSTYPNQTLHILGEGIHTNIPDGHEHQTMTGRLISKTLRRIDEDLTKHKSAIPLDKTPLGELPVFARQGRTHKSMDEFDVAVVVPSVPAFISEYKITIS